jgi:glucose/arabinose dehydrogenase
MTIVRTAASYLGVLLVAALSLQSCGGIEDVPPAALGAQPAFASLNFTSPVAMLQAPGDNSRWFVVEQGGFVRVFANDPTATILDTFIDIDDRVDSGGEMGLLGMAFHPGFPADPRVFVHYTNEDSGRVSRISEFTSSNGGATLDPISERILLIINQPEANHNGGHLAFGPDGYLYIGMGDGGGGNDAGPLHGPIGNGQNMMTLLGKMLRIDVSPAIGYAIPADNAFPSGNPQCGGNGTGTVECPEIYASGFRNPWRWSFDRLSGQLWLGDVGQGAREEIDRVVLGGNYGWRCFEGTLATGLACGSEPNLQAPVAEYERSVGTTVTGGYVYRGTAIRGLAGRYVFGDFTSGRIWHIVAGTQPTVRVTDGFDSGLNISSFGEGNDGELYLVHYGGQLYRLTGS